MTLNNFNFRQCRYFLLFFFLVSQFSFSQYTENIISKHLLPSTNMKGAYEISNVSFIGNDYFTAVQLVEYISSRETRMSIPHKILSTYYRQSKKNKYIPNIFVDALANSLTPFKKEYNYFNEEMANNDIQVLLSLYNTNGFHDIHIYFSFEFDTVTQKNKLTFHINEGNQYKLSSPINYVGLEDLPIEVLNRIDTVKKLNAGDAFNEQKIENEIINIHSILLRTGYMHAQWRHQYPKVIKDTVNFKDSVIAYFDTDKRYKIGKIIFTDSTFGQQVVADRSKKKLLIFSEGDYYNKNRIERSIDNLFSIGTFGDVRIDTVERYYASDEFVRDFEIKSKYRNLREWQGEVFVNQTEFDQLVNTGIEGGLLHRNIFGSAQVLKLFANFSIKDINKTISNKFNASNFEIKTGFSYTQTHLWQIETARVALSTSLQYSLEILNGLLKISKVSFPISFPTRLARNSYFNSLLVEFNFDREVPLNFEDLLQTMYSSSTKTQHDTNNVLSALFTYGRINEYLREPYTHIFTSNLITLMLSGDNRNHPFAPTKGSFTFIGIDGFNIFLSHPAISGGAKFFRLQTQHTKFWQLSKSLVLGAKGKVGLTYLFNEANTFVPQDKQFFAGGANSVRAWSARQLRYTNVNLNYIDSLFGESSTLTNFANIFVGSKSVIEGSVELRRKLSDVPGLSENIVWIFNDLEVGLFLDVGNAFGWYLEDVNNQTNIKLTDYFTKLAVATGAGIRYLTPIGPIRLDFALPVYDPLSIKKPFSFSELTFVFAIGHAF